MHHYKKLLALFLVSFLLFSCGDDSEEESSGQDELVSCYQVNIDSAYQFIVDQVDMGPRIPGTPVQKECASWLESKLSQYADKVYVQNTKVTVAGKSLPCINLIGSLNPEAETRILLCAHWDTRPWADKEDKSLKIDGADDGGSGTALLLEIARQLHGKLNNIGVDILLVDVEDYGGDAENSYCKGSQYWAENPHVPGYTAKFGILLDMIAGKGNSYYQDLYSKEYAQNVLNEVWNTAYALGYGAYFHYSPGMGVVDDHYYINTIAHIPTIDIIGSPNGANFPAYHHTTQDNLENIDKNLLGVVGNTVVQVICQEDQSI